MIIIKKNKIRVAKDSWLSEWKRGEFDPPENQNIRENREFPGHLPPSTLGIESIHRDIIYILGVKIIE